MFMKMRRARFFAQFILSGQSEILRYAQDDSREAFFRSLFRRASLSIHDTALKGAATKSSRRSRPGGAFY